MLVVSHLLTITCLHKEAVALVDYRQQLYWQITALEQAYKSQHETILADLYLYRAKTYLAIILTDDAIKYKCIWPLA